MAQIATTKEQSRKLLVELGIDMNTADMYYYNNDEIPQIISDIKSLKENINPKFYTLAWSLPALLDILPFPQLSRDKLGSGKAGWMASAYPNDCRHDSYWHDNPIDACCELIVKLHKLNFL